MPVNALSRWEQRSDHYSNLGMRTDLSKLKEEIKNQTRVMIKNQLATANAIIISQQRISEGMDIASYGIKEVAQGIQGLQTAFEWGISDIVWQIEQNREVLKDIRDLIESPLATRAREHRQRGEEAYAAGLIDDAEKEFLKSERLNRFDFPIHIGLGVIYQLKKVDKAKALSYFEKAAQYAKPKSLYHASIALLHKAVIEFDLGDTVSAEQSTFAAIELSPDLSEAYYQNAQYNAQLGHAEKSTRSLQTAIEINKLYCLNADKDDFFDPIRKEIDSLFLYLRDTEKEISLNALEKILERYNRLRSFIEEIANVELDGISTDLDELSEITSDISGIQSKLARDTYFDYLAINKELLPGLERRQSQFVSSLQGKITSFLSTSRRKVEESQKATKEVFSAYRREHGLTIIFLMFLVPAVAGLLSFQTDWDRFWAFIGFCIPVISQLKLLFHFAMFAFAFSEVSLPDIAIVGSFLILVIGVFAHYSRFRSEYERRLGREVEANCKFLDQAIEFHSKGMSI